MKILVVEDSPVLSRSLLKGLQAEGFVIDVMDNGEDALVALRTHSYDAIVLDRMLPKMDGLEVLRRLRGEMGSKTPVLLLTALAEVTDRVQGLDTGADDYLPKPFDFGELVSRLRALCRRSGGTRAPVVHLGRLSLDTSACEATVEGQRVSLTASEFRVLEALVVRRGQVITKDWLLDQLHGADGYASGNAVEVFISALRRKLRERGVDDLIQTKRGLGYLIPLDGSEGS
tara:strand:- start:379 stop:1068 length:690 start_codon:yes stop_codon:yes gene_type:complete